MYHFTFLVIFKYLLTTCCQTNKQNKTGGKNNLYATVDWEVFYLSCDAIECKHLHFAFQNKQALSEGEQKTVL